jgi:cellulose synthase/poly-beta-1,6-N-acetylglucosamine synthase-like glycosyltransferase
MTLEIALYIVYGFLLMSLFLVILIILQKAVNNRLVKLQGYARDYLFKHYFDGEPMRMPFHQRFFFDAYIDIETQVEIDPVVRDQVVLDLRNTRFCKKQIKRLKSFSVFKRKTAVFYVGALDTEEAMALIKKRFLREKNDSVRFFMLYQLITHMDQEIFDHTLKSLIGAPASYQRWVSALMKNHFSQISDFIEPHLIDTEVEIRLLLVHLSAYHLSEKLKSYAIRQFHESVIDLDVRMKALEALAKMYPLEIANDDFCKNENDDVKRVAIRAASNIVSQEFVDHMLQSMNGSPLDSERVNSLSRIVYDSKTLLLYIVEYYNQTKILVQKEAIARVLSHRIDYLVLKLKGGGYDYVRQIIEHILELHIIEDFIDFMNHNKDKQFEKSMLSIIKKHAAKDMYLLDQFSIYLKQDILSQMGIMKKPQPVIPREKSPLEKDKIVWISTWVLVGVLFMPLLYLVTNFNLIFSGTIKVFEYMVVSINTYLVVYFMTINAIYLILLLISVRGSEERINMWQIKKQTFLFEHDVLPSISIIAPAYNEEKSIIESVTSLLNLKYPKYEVIVVNDGSKDQTIDVLIEHFELERKHPFFKLKLKTKQLRGVYVNKHIPNLIVIDKQNGGKADALNLGINVAKSDYVCGIDADSLLEEDALLKLMSVTLDDTKDHIALGGNIVPVNGCVVDKGKIEHYGLSDQPVVRFQTLEYLRAFTTGRIGWSKINSLMIISGAFGLFNRKTLLETGGYLTISGELKKDTVGEDMELVVRLTYQALKKKLPYRVDYVHHANCYTELPSDMKTLLKQRNRWQRGLLDILSYHRKILFNPKYKQAGLIAFPFFFIFEMIGPFIETIGYLMLIIGLIMGILNVPLVMMLLVATIGLGIWVSLFSLWIAERKNVFYSTKETFALILTAIIENFGYRQIMSIHRVISTYSALKESGSWGSQTRTGFQKK